VARQAQPQSAAAEILVGSVQQVAPGTVKLDLPDPVAPQEVGMQESDLDETALPVPETALDVQRLETPANPKDDLDVQTNLPPTDAPPTTPDETDPDETNPDDTKADPPAGAPTVSGAPSGEASPPVTPPRKPKPFGKKPKLADETSSTSPAVSGDSVGTPNPPKSRFTEPKKHRLTGSPSDSTGSPTRSAPSS
jgi:hypothetical protein